MSKYKGIVLPSDLEYVQTSLFANQKREGLDLYPPLSIGEEGVRRVVMSATPEEGLGYDLEFSGLQAEIVGVATTKEAAACRWTPELGRWIDTWCLEHGIAYVGHSVLSADKPILEYSARISTDRLRWRDSLLTFWLAHHGLTKMPAKDEDTESLGLMNLGVMGMLHTDLPMWKKCRGKDCDEYVCPRHRVENYCSVDAYVGLVGELECKKILAEKKVPATVLADLHELQEISLAMQARGTAVDHAYIATLDQVMADEQAKLFAPKGNPEYRFNPKSPKEVAAWFAARKVKLPKTDKDAVQTALEKQAREEGWDYEKFEDLKAFLDERAESGEPLPEHIRALNDLHSYKMAGKGTKSWFDPKYFGEDGRLHPRFVITGTSTGRLSSSRPNLQNVPKRGWGKKIRRAFLPESKNHFLFESDFSQLELRIILYLAGVDQSVIGADAFSWLVQQAGGLFDRAAQKFGGKARDIAKMVSHGSNYLMGFKLFSANDLRTVRYKNEIAKGALRIYHQDYSPVERNWFYNGKVVGFTGSHLAASMFGNKSLESRAKALEIQEDTYFAAFRMIRNWQQDALEKSERDGYVQSPVGRFLELDDTPEKNAKLTVAFLGQGVGADYATGVMLEYKRQRDWIAQGMIHDALVSSLPKSWTPEEVYAFGKFMECETPRLPGFTCPVKMECGPNWGTMYEFEKRESGIMMKTKEGWVPAKWEWD